MPLKQLTMAITLMAQLALSQSIIFLTWKESFVKLREH